jgi:peptidoglycan/xylan/chitin deacetylase (PgdA/CDA1 family)
MKNIFLFLLIFTLCASVSAQTANNYTPLREKEFNNETFYKYLSRDNSYLVERREVIRQTESYTPGKWGEFVKGVNARLLTDEKIVAFTFDACGGKNRNGYDQKLIDYLRKEKIPATLFITGLWIDDNYETFVELSKDSLFEIENHGYTHQPCSMNGECKYGIRGTNSPAEAFDEIEANEQKIKAITGRRPLYYRSATAYIDEASACLANRLGVAVVAFDVLSGDAVAKEKPEVIRDNVLKGVRPGSIIIMHFNHPEGNTLEALKKIIPKLRKEGYRFDHLKDYSLRPR